MVGDRGGAFQSPAVLEVGRDAGGPERVIADLGGDACRLRPPLNHGVGLGAGEGRAGEFGGPAPDRAEQRAVRVLADAGPVQVGVQVAFQVVVTGQGHRLAALLVQAHPQAAVLHEHVLDPHGGGRADPREGVDHQPDQSAVAQTDRCGGVDRVQDRAGLLWREHGGLAPLDHMLRPPDGGGRVERQHPTGCQPVEHHADRGEALLDRGGAVGPAHLLDVGRDMDRADGRDRGEAVRFQPGAELAHGLGVGPPGVGVPDLRREEFQEAVGGAVARRCHQGRGGIAG